MKALLRTSLVVLAALWMAPVARAAEEVGNTFLMTAPSAMWWPSSETNGAATGNLVIPGASEVLVWGQPGKEGYLKTEAFVRAWAPGKTFAKSPPNAALTYQRFGRAYHAVMTLTDAVYDAKSDVVTFTATVIGIKDDPFGGGKLPNAIAAPQLYIDNIFSDIWDDIKDAAHAVANEVESIADEVARGATIAFDAVTSAAVAAYHGVVDGAEIVYQEGISIEGDVVKLGDRVVDGIEHDGSLLIGYAEDLEHYAVAEVTKIAELVEANACRIAVGGILDGALFFALGPDDVEIAAALKVGGKTAVSAALSTIVKGLVPIIHKVSQSKSPDDWEQFVLNVITSALGSGSSTALFATLDETFPAAVLASAISSAVTTAVCQGLPQAPIPPTSVMPPMGIPAGCWSTVTTRTQDYLSVHPERGPCYAYDQAVSDALSVPGTTCPAPMNAPAGQKRPSLFLPYSGASAEFCPTGKGINIVRADWGANQNTENAGNATSALAIACNSESSCAYTVSLAALGDPAVGQAKTFIATYTCGNDSLPYFANGAQPGADNSKVIIACPKHAEQQIYVTTATYGNGVQSGNYASYVRSACDGQSSCTFTVSPSIGDPAPGQAKSFVAGYVCGSDPAQHFVSGPIPASDGATLQLSCAPADQDNTVVLAATYGTNCGQPFGNISSAVIATCGNSSGLCSYVIDGSSLSLPQDNCLNDVIAQYQCAGQGSTVFYASGGATPPNDGVGEELDFNCTSQGQGNIRVIEATFGGNWGATRGNASSLARQCDGVSTCPNPFWTTTDLGDPKPGYVKDFVIRYLCEGDPTVYFTSAETKDPYSVSAPPLNCPAYAQAAGSLAVVQATYGGNQKGSLGNATAFVRNACTTPPCTFTVDVNQTGDFAPGLAKDFAVEWQCLGDTSNRRAYIPEEANGQSVTLSCN